MMNKMGWFGGGAADGIHNSLSKDGSKADSETHSDRSDSPASGSSIVESGGRPPSSGSSSSNGSNGNGGGSIPSPSSAAMTRLPSTDALNRSLHNNSNHGPSSSSSSSPNNTNTTIQELRTANATLINKLSTMEADFMNQVHDVTSQMAQRELKYKEEAKEQSLQLSTFQNRVASAERRMRERDQQMSGLKEEKARQMHMITDLKNQLYQLQFDIEETSADKADEIQKWQMQLVDSQRAFDEVTKAKSEMEKKLETFAQAMENVKKEKMVLERQLEEQKQQLSQQQQQQQQQQERGGNNNNNETLKRCQELEQLVLELQTSLKQHQQQQQQQDSNAINNNKHDIQQQQIEQLQSTNQKLQEELQTERMSTSRNKKISQKEIANLRSMLRARDDAIQSLQLRLEKGQGEMTSLEEELDTLRNQLKDSKTGNEDVGNLWRLNDEMAKIIEGQSKSLEQMTEKLEQRKLAHEEQVALVATRKSEMEELRLLLEEKERQVCNTEALLEKQTVSLEKRKADVEEERGTVEKLTKRMEESTKRAEEQAAQNSFLSKENHSLRSQLSAHETSLANSSSSHARVITLEMEVQTMNEKMEELTQSLEESMEEISDLQADIVYKDGKIASLERELEEAAGLLEASVRAEETAHQLLENNASSSEKFARLRKEIEDVTRQRAQLESEHARDIAELEDKLKETNEGAASVRKQLNEENAKVVKLRQSIEGLEKSEESLLQELELVRKEMESLRKEGADSKQELEELEQTLQELENENEDLQTEIEDLRNKTSDSKEPEEAQCFEMTKELREAQQALIALDKERSLRLDASKQKIESLTVELSECKEQIRTGETKFNRVIRERELMISDLKKEVSAKEQYANELRSEVEALQQAAERTGSPRRSDGVGMDPDSSDPDSVSKLKARVSTLEKEKNMIESELRAKLEDRDATIATLVASSSSQEQKLASLQVEIDHLHVLLEEKSSSENFMKQQIKGLEAIVKNDGQRKEVESLKSKIKELKMELCDSRGNFAAVSEELECANTQIQVTRTRPEVKDLAGKLAASDRALRINKEETEEKLRERDTAISNLLESVQANEATISSLRSEIEDFKKRRNQNTEENRRLQHESEIFAAQVIEQDEELESLNKKLAEKTNHISLLKKEIESNKSDEIYVASLQEKVDELQENKRRNLRRIDELERKLDEAESNSKNVERNGFEVEKLKVELQNAITTKEFTEEKLTNQIESLRKLRNHAVEDYEAKLRDSASQITSLEKELLELREQISDNVVEIPLDGAPSQDQLNELTDKCLELAEERDMLKMKIGALNQDIEALSGATESQQVSELRSKLNQSEQMREALEKNRSMSNSSKDAEIDRLHRQLSEAKEVQSAKELEQLSRLNSLEKEHRKLREEYGMRMKEKTAKILALEQTLAAQEQVVRNMSREMDQLQNGMEKISVQRRAEVEEMQQELMDYTSKATRLEREVTALSMKLDEKKLRHKDEVAKLKERISNLESEAPSERTMQRVKGEDNQREKELEHKNEHLRWLNSSLKDENEKLQQKLEILATAKTSPESPKNAKNDKWRNVALQEQVAVLTHRVIELEEEAAGSGKRRVSGSPRTTSILQSPVMRSSLEAVTPGKSTPRSSSTPRSALRVSTHEDSNSANQELLSNSLQERPPISTRRYESPQATIPRQSTTPKLSEKSKSSRSSKMGFGMMRKSSSRSSPKIVSPKFDDASNSTTNYNF